MKTRSTGYLPTTTDSVQNARQGTTRTLIEKPINEASTQDWNGKFLDTEKLVTSLQKRVMADMDAQACTESPLGLNFYYMLIGPLAMLKVWC